MAAAPPENAPACALYADTPARHGDTLSATGGRTGCTNSANVTVRLVTRQSSPRVLGELSQSGTEVALTPHAKCKSGGKAVVYTEVESSTGAIYRSPAVTFNRC